MKKRHTPTSHRSTFGMHVGNSFIISFSSAINCMYLNECENSHLNYCRCLCPRAYCVSKLNDGRTNERKRANCSRRMYAGNENNLYQWSVSIYTIINSIGHKEVARHDSYVWKHIGRQDVSRLSAPINLLTSNKMHKTEEAWSMLKIYFSDDAVNAHHGNSHEIR